MTLKSEDPTEVVPSRAGSSSPDESRRSSSPDSSASSTVTSTTSNSSFPLPPQRPKTNVLDEDKNTPDKHVPRDSRLIRLTGVHPFNVEAPLTALFNEGFLTTQELFYVRNHGAVPEVHDEDMLDWECEVDGLVESPFKFTVRELMADFEQITLPITLVCAGNRRKEQNMVRKSKGFSWGPAGLSTALFTGVILSDVIEKARPRRKARYVCMEGADELPNGRYTTNVKLNWVMDDNRGIMLSYRMNGDMLEPDHGKPLRVVIPGQIGGRSVKWLKRLTLTEHPSDNWYHIYDNRVLPTMVSPEESANNTKWWTDERYAIYDLSSNSAIAFPAHDERLNLDDGLEKYRIRGYAYGGGGRRITRVEISLDKGSTWKLSTIEYPEDAYRAVEEDLYLYGGRLDMSWREASFCWCFWDLEVDVADLAKSSDVCVRCMDESMNIQPRDMYWSVLGMMNNPWFRVTITKEDNSLHFEHPTQPALIPGGWMDKVKKAGGNLTNGYWGERIGDEEIGTIAEVQTEVKMTSEKIDKKITIDEFKQHDNDSEPWFVLNGEVFDGTPFLKEHPGGALSITSVAGTDATEEFLAIHSETAKIMMPEYHIGTLDKEATALLTSASEEIAPADREIFLQPKAWTKAILDSKKTISSDTKIFTFKLDHEEQVLGLATGQHVMFRLRDPATREMIIRAYTPISHELEKGKVDVLVKIYGDTKERKGGRMSQAVDALPVGHAIEFKGPVGKLVYYGRGRCSINGKERRVKSFVMLCGGSGITPIYQIFRAVLSDEEDRTRCIVLNSNRRLEDILCKTALDEICARDAEKGQIYYTLTQANEDWTGLKGRITKDLLQKHAPKAADTMALICGPEGLEKSAHRELIGLGWHEDDIVFF